MGMISMWSYFPKLVMFMLFFAGIACGSSASQDVSFSLDIRERALWGTKLPLKVNQNDIVTMVINSDVRGTFHLHGYNIEKEIIAGGSSTLEFQATATGSFPFTFHNYSGAHDHSHEKSIDLCEVAVPENMLTPTIELIILEPLSERELRIRVKVANFILSSKTQDAKNMLSGHWHLFIDDQLAGMYTANEISVPAPGKGHHQLVATLTNNLHCSYGIRTSTGIELGSQSNESHSQEDMQSMMESEMELGRIEVHP